MQTLPNQHNDLPSLREKERRGSGLSSRMRLGLAGGVLVSGTVLLHLGGGFPPQACRELLFILNSHGVAPGRLGIILIQSFAEGIAWLLLVLVTIQLFRPGHPQTAQNDEEELIDPEQKDQIPQETLVASTVPTDASPTPILQYTPDDPGKHSNGHEEQNPRPPSTTSPFGSLLFPEFPDEDPSLADSPQMGMKHLEGHPHSVANTTASQAKTSETAGINVPSAVNRQGNDPLLAPKQGAVGTEPFPSLSTIFNDSTRGDAAPTSFRIRWDDFLPPDANKGIVFTGWFLCHPGKAVEKEALEDAVLVTSGVRTKRQPPTSFAFFILADGIAISSHSTTGRIVSRALAEALLSVLWGTDPLDQEGVKTLLTNGLLYANSILFQQNQQFHTSNIATLSVVLLLGAIAYIANVGDNRVYFYRAHEGMVQVTFDHSSIEQLLEQGQITAQELFKLPKETHVHRVLGKQASIPIDVFAVKLQAHDLLLMCSDGVWKLVQQGQFDQRLDELIRPAKADLFLLCSEIVRQALAGGGYDRASALVLQPQVIGSPESEGFSTVTEEETR